MRCYACVFAKLTKNMLNANKTIRFSRSFRFSLLIPLRQPKGFLLKHKHTVYFWLPFFCFLA